MKRKFLSILKYVFFLGLGIFLVWWQFDKMTSLQKDQFTESLKNTDYWLLIPVLFLSLLSHLSRAVRWKILMEPMGYKPSTANTFYAVMSGYLLNTFVPRAGEILKCTLLSKAENIPSNKLIGSILVERTFDFICYLIFILFTVFIQINLVSAFVKGKISKMAESSGISIWIKLLIATVVLFLIIIFVKWLFKRFAHRKSVIGIKKFFTGLKEGFLAIAHLKNKGWFIFHTFFIWAMYLLQVYIGFSALSATSHLGIAEACSVLSLATLGMIVSPGGIGAFPFAVQEVLLIYNVDNVSFGWVMWGVATVIIVVVGLICFGLLVNKNNRSNEAKQTNIAKAI